MPSPLITLEHIVDLDYEAVARNIKSFIRGYVAYSGARGAVVGVSGGVDSATTLYLLVEALGSNRVIALIMPDARVTPREDVEDALALVKSLGVDHRVYRIDDVVDAYIRVAGEAGKKTVGNLRARIRMTLLYYVANEEGYLVAGTGDRSELLIGYFTKYGDGAADFTPISVLYKSQVRRLARHLGVPERIAFKPSAPRLWEGHLAEQELGVSYDDVDKTLFALVDLGLPPSMAAEATGVGMRVVDRVSELMAAARHKIIELPSPRLESIYEAWRGLEKARRALAQTLKPSS